jgi:hypothetical protein
LLNFIVSAASPIAPGLTGAASETPDPASVAAPMTANIEALNVLMAFSQVKSGPLPD